MNLIMYSRNQYKILYPPGIRIMITGSASYISATLYFYKVHSLCIELLSRCVRLSVATTQCTIFAGTSYVNFLPDLRPATMSEDPGETEPTQAHSPLQVKESGIRLRYSNGNARSSCNFTY